MPDEPEQPRRRATALHYEPGSTAPQITATGSGYIAERLIEAAREAGVPVRSDPALATALPTLDLGAAGPAPLNSWSAAESHSRRRRRSWLWIWQTRLSLTPSASPISLSVKLCR